MARRRLDILMVERGLAESRAKAQALVLAGQVLVDREEAQKAGTLVDSSAAIEVVTGLPFVSRGGLKLQAALSNWQIEVKHLVALDVGASTGGFTDCLLQHGAERVYAVDVGYGQLAWSLRQDPRVIVIERTNIRYLESLPELVDMATVDVSFISLEKVLPSVLRLSKPQAIIITLVKPQFEAGKAQVEKGGVVRDQQVHRQVLRRLLSWAANQGLKLKGLMASPILGPAGNREFLAYWRKGKSPVPDERMEKFIEEAVGRLSS